MDNKLDGIYVPLTMSRNMKSRALAAGIDPELLSANWKLIIGAVPLAYQEYDKARKEALDDLITLYGITFSDEIIANEAFAEFVAKHQNALRLVLQSYCQQNHATL